MAFRLFDKTIQSKVFAKPIGQVKAGRNRVAAVGQTEWSIVPKTPGEAFKISWTARNDDTIPGTVGLALLDGDGNSRAVTAGVILQPGETKDLKLNYTVPEGQASDESIWTIAMIPLAWEDAPAPETPEFTYLAYGSPQHTFVVSYTDSKTSTAALKARKEYDDNIGPYAGQIPFKQGWQTVLANYKYELEQEEKNYNAYLKALNDEGVSPTEVDWNHGDWRGLMETFLEAREANKKKLPIVDPNIKIKEDWLSALQANGLSQDELSLADFQSGFLTQVLSNREAKTKQETDRKGFLAAWGNMREEMAEAGFAVPGPSYPGYGWEAEFAATRDSYADRRDYNSVFKLALRNNPTITQKQPEYSPGWQNRLSGWTDRAVTQAETERVVEDKSAWVKEKNRTGVTVPYSANWQSALKNAVSKRDSDAIRDRLAKETKARQDAIREAAAAIRVAAQLKIQRANEASVLSRARAALRQQQQQEQDEDEYNPSDYVSTRRDTPAVVPDRSPAPAASKETSTERNRIAPVYVSKYIDHRQVRTGGNARVVESSSGNFLTIFTHEATGEEGDVDDFI